MRVRTCGLDIISRTAKLAGLEPGRAVRRDVTEPPTTHSPCADGDRP